MSYRVRYTRMAREDMVRLYRFLLDRDAQAAARALEAIEQGVSVLRTFPFSCRKADVANPFLREMIIPFGAQGYVMLFEIESAEQVTVLAVRHQREDDYR
ncbi:type II toxin-antitoxin system RelE/ParE family toxin [Burkholderia sp. PU8-34]